MRTLTANQLLNSFDDEVRPIEMNPVCALFGYDVANSGQRAMLRDLFGGQM